MNKSMIQEDSNLEELYLRAKKAYYTGEPIMSDDEFDRLEEHLKSENSPVLDIVGFDDEDRNAKFNHPSKMLSLAKYQASVSGTPPLQAMGSWIKAIGVGPEFEYEATPKFDGNAINVIYHKGKLHAILSRGNGTAGRDYTKKLINRVPNTIGSTAEVVEVRGEVVIETKVFNEKYSQFKNERNFVAGILNRDEDVEEIVKNFHFMAVEVREHDGKTITWLPINKTFEWGFSKEQPLMRMTFTVSDENSEFIKAVYYEMLDYRRRESPFRLDGFVIKAPIHLRPQLGENSHDPNWAVAIKFPPQEAITTIKSIKWNFGKTGEFTPIAIMEPTDLDGTTVTKATMFNFGYVKQKGTFPGAEVSIVKSGDIIPQIVKVTKPNHWQPVGWFPTHCSKCNHELEIDGIHLICPSESCTGKKYYKFIQGFNHLSVDGSGGVAIRKLWDAGFTSAIDILDKTKFNKENLIKSGQFKDGKTLDKLIAEVSTIKEIPLRKILLMIAFDGMGGKTATEVAKKLADHKFNFAGLEKRVVAGFDKGQEKRTLVDNAIEVLKRNGISIVLPEVVNEEDITFEMTGSPKAFGFSTKAEFVNYAKSKGYRHTGLKDAKVLFTDDKTSSSGKMKDAVKKGVVVMLYSEL